MTDGRWRKSLRFATGLSSSCALIVACTQTQTPTAPIEAEAPPAQVEAPTEKSEKPELATPKGQEVSFEKEFRLLTQIRGLEPRGEVSGLRVKTKDLIDHVKQAIELETPKRAVLGTEAMLQCLSVVPAGFDYEATMWSLLTERLAGMYQPRLKMMLIREGLPKALADVTLLHELVHALQDQYYDIGEIVEWSEDDTDRSSALSSLAEGDATSAMWDSLLPEGETAISLPPGHVQERMNSAPPEGIPKIIASSVMAPYLDGVTFVHALRRRGGFSEVDRVWKKPPATTEQILHLEKYDSGEPALTVTVPASPGEEWTELLHDSWGEQNLRLILRDWMEDQNQADESAAGWGGDRIAVFSRGEERTLSWSIEMDSVKEAEELFEALREATTSGDSVEDPLSFCGPLARASEERLSAPLLVSRSEETVTLKSAPLNPQSGKARSCKDPGGWFSTPPKVSGKP